MAVATVPRGLALPGHELLIELAAGGMATVYVARKVGAAGFERLVVVKRVHPLYARNREFADMFRDEARICSTIRHPNVASLLDVVEADGELFLVIEYVESLSLSALSAAVAARGETLPSEVVVRIMADALAGLHAAHETKDLRGNRLDVIHRDVSPQNLLVGLDGASRLIDFGVAKAASRISATQSGALKGKLSYMSPEQVRRRPLDRRSDVFAAGVVLFEALTLRKLFAGEDEGAVVLGILVAEVPPPSSLVPGVPAALDAVVARALAQEPDERYPTAAAFAEALEQALPPAATRDVSRVVERYGGAVLAERRARLEAATIEPSGEVLQAPPVEAEPTLADPSRSRRELAWFTSATARALGIVGIVAIAAAVAVFVDRRRAAASPPTEPVAASVPASASAPATAAAPPPEPRVPVTSAAAPDASAPSRPRAPRATPAPDLHRRNPYGPP